MYLIYQYPGVLEDFRAKCAQDDAMLRELDIALRLLKEEGPYLDWPTAEELRDGFFQLRPQTKDRKGRLLYYWDEVKTLEGVIEERAVIVYGFFKTTQKTPSQAFTVATLRRNELARGAAQEVPIWQ